MGWSGSKPIKCKYFDFKDRKCLHKGRRNWYTILKPDCIIDKDYRAKCSYKTTE